MPADGCFRLLFTASCDHMHWLCNPLCIANGEFGPLHRGCIACSPLPTNMDRQESGRDAAMRPCGRCRSSHLHVRPSTSPPLHAVHVRCAASRRLRRSLMTLRRDRRHVEKRPCVAVGLVARDRQVSRQRSASLLGPVADPNLRDRWCRAPVSFHFGGSCADQSSSVFGISVDEATVDVACQAHGLPTPGIAAISRSTPRSSLDAICMQALDPTDLSHTVCPRAPDG